MNGFRNIFRVKTYTYIWYLKPERKVLVLTVYHTSATSSTRPVVLLGMWMNITEKSGHHLV